jgi:hypothetical protein
MSPSNQQPDHRHRREAWITDDLQSALLAALERRRRRRRDGEPAIVVPAAVIGRWLRVPGLVRETRRRRVRDLVTSLRERGIRVCAEDGATGGYYLPIDAADLVHERERLRRGGLARLIGASAVDRSVELSDATGQLALFAAG